MKKENDLWRSIVSCILIVALMFCAPFESLAQSTGKGNNVLENGTRLVLRVNEPFKADNKADTATISSIVETDVYSADGSRVLIKAGTPADMNLMDHGVRPVKYALLMPPQKQSTTNVSHFVSAVAKTEEVSLEALSFYQYCCSHLVL